MNSIIISKRAQKEITISFLWYEGKQELLGDRFVEEVYDVLGKIEKYPKRYAVKKPPYHETILKIFPFLIIYRYSEVSKEIFISSVFHFSRNPKKKYR